MNEKVKVPDRDNVPYLRIYGAPGQPVRLWRYDGLVRSMFRQTNKPILPQMWNQDFIQYPPGES